MSKKAIMLCLAFFAHQTSFQVKGMFGGSPSPKQDKIFSPSEIILNLVATHYLADHSAICAFASTSKDYKNLMMATAKNRRQNTLKYACPTPQHFGKLVHPYGSAYCYAYQSPYLTNLNLNYHQLDNSETTFKSQQFWLFISPLPVPNKSMLFFNEQGALCFYGYGEHEYQHATIPGRSQNLRAIIHYCLDGSIMPCTLQIQEKSWPINALLSYPHLLKAILAVSGKKMILADQNYSIPYWTFSLGDIIVPDNYKERIEFKYDTDRFDSDASLKLFFEDFPEYVKDAIKKRYQEQKIKQEICS